MNDDTRDIRDVAAYSAGFVFLIYIQIRITIEKASGKNKGKKNKVK